MEMLPVTCPTCFEAFEITAPPLGEVPAQVDYDCEICCRPMVILFDSSGGKEITAVAQSLDD